MDLLFSIPVGLMSVVSVLLSIIIIITLAVMLIKNSGRD